MPATLSDPSVLEHVQPQVLRELLAVAFDRERDDPDAGGRERDFMGECAGHPDALLGNVLA